MRVIEFNGKLLRPTIGLEVKSNLHKSGSVVVCNGSNLQMRFAFTKKEDTTNADKDRITLATHYNNQIVTNPIHSLLNYRLQTSRFTTSAAAKLDFLQLSCQKLGTETNVLNN